MREECKFFESRTYSDGETVRKCELDLAPEAPWRCPEGCTSFAPRSADVNWAHGSLVTPPTPDEPASLEEHGDDIAALLDEAEDIVNAAGPAMLAEVRAEDIRKDPSSGAPGGFGQRLAKFTGRFRRRG